MFTFNFSTIENEQYKLLVKNCYHDLYVIAYWFCKDPSVSEELVTMTFIEALELLPYLNGERSTKYYLIKILYQLYVHKPVEPTKYTFGICNSKLSKCCNNNSTQEYRLKEAVWMLDDKYRIPIVMQVIAGLDIAEISQILGANHCLVKQRVAYARLHLIASKQVK